MTYKNILETIRRHRRFLVVSHHNPDADALASTLVMALYLKGLGKTVYALNEDACPQWLEFLPATSMLKKAGDVKKFDYDAAVVLDCGDLKRIGGVNAFLCKGKPLINIDHHVTNERFGTLNVVKPDASSTCELVFDLLKEAGCPLNKKTAILLYAGIMTDTGSFRFDNTTAYSHEVVRELMAFKFSPPDMYGHLYVGIPVADMKRFTDLIHKARLTDNNRVFCISLSQVVVKSFSPSFDLKEKLFAFLRSIEGIEVVVILTELNPKEIRVNLRSQNHFDVARLAKTFDGGGHRKAAGCKIYGTLAQAQKIIGQAIHQRLRTEGA
ncbi:MAG: bifunctional oligoribonuclease/PAP phosphatase NrnA [Candidatus Omnitrophica bacterium]|nr:bifunctional oligoribonuclease/PAP phosphatase NrnA [Candidatus Omnitrophota bacterium]MDE2221861.1 bifunctional oligoribonuclease/PAP phosphatase NrnA [Candidatus Omnitrophota bacterium]